MFEGELEESMAELEESRRKLINMKMQKDGVSGMHIPIPIPVIVPNVVNGTLSPEKPVDRSKRLRELKESIEEIKVFIYFFGSIHTLPCLSCPMAFISKFRWSLKLNTI